MKRKATVVAASSGTNTVVVADGEPITVEVVDFVAGRKIYLEALPAWLTPKEARALGDVLYAAARRAELRENEEL